MNINFNTDEKKLIIEGCSITFLMDDSDIDKADAYAMQPINADSNGTFIHRQLFLEVVDALRNALGLMYNKEFKDYLIEITGLKEEYIDNLNIADWDNSEDNENITDNFWERTDIEKKISQNFMENSEDEIDLTEDDLLLLQYRSPIIDNLNSRKLKYNEITELYFENNNKDSIRVFLDSKNYGLYDINLCDFIEYTESWEKVND